MAATESAPPDLDQRLPQAPEEENGAHAEAPPSKEVQRGNPEAPNTKGSALITKMLENLTKTQQIAKDASQQRKERHARLQLEATDQGLSDKSSWRRRKISVDNYSDRQCESVAQLRGRGDYTGAAAVLEQSYRRLMPMLCDPVWWVRRTTVVALVRLAQLDPHEENPVREAAGQQVIGMGTPEARYAAARVVTRSRVLGVAESQALVEVMLQALGDEHWMVRAEARTAVAAMCAPGDPRVLVRGAELLAHARATMRQAGVALLGESLAATGRHDAARDCFLARRLLDSPLFDENGSKGEERLAALDPSGEGRPRLAALLPALAELAGLELSLARLGAFVRGEASDGRASCAELERAARAHAEGGTAEGGTAAEGRGAPAGGAQGDCEALLAELLEALPVDYAPAALLARNVKAAYAREADPVTRGKLLAYLTRALPLGDADLPWILARTLVHAQAAQLCLAALAAWRELVTALGAPALRCLQRHRLRHAPCAAQEGAPEPQEVVAEERAEAEAVVAGAGAGGGEGDMGAAGMTPRELRAVVERTLGAGAAAGLGPRPLVDAAAGEPAAAPRLGAMGAGERFRAPDENGSKGEEVVMECEELDMCARLVPLLHHSNRDLQLQALEAVWELWDPAGARGKRQALLAAERQLRLALKRLHGDWEWALEKFWIEQDEAEAARLREAARPGAAPAGAAPVVGLSRTESLARGKRVAARPELLEDAALPARLMGQKRELNAAEARHEAAVTAALGAWQADRDVFHTVRRLSQDVNLGRVYTRAAQVMAVWGPAGADPGAQPPDLELKPKKFKAAVSALIASVALARVITNERADLLARHPPDWGEDGAPPPGEKLSRAPSNELSRALSRAPSNAPGTSRRPSAADPVSRTASLVRVPSAARR